MDAQRLGGEAKSAYDTVARRGMEPVAVRGAIQVGNGYANAYTESGKVYFRVDAVDSAGNAISPEALVRHELFHNYISEEALKASAEVIRESMTAEEYDGMYEAYRDAYASIYDFETMSVEEIERILREEIAADAYAGLNWFSGDAPVQEAVRAETERNAPAQRAEAQQETTGPPEGRAQAFVGYDAETGRGIYRSNFEENTPKAKKSERVIRLIQDVWSKNPIDLVVENEDGSKSVIKAEFDPRFDEGENTRSDAAKLAAGNRHGTAGEKRVTLNLADDFYRIIQESTYSGSKAETGKTSDTHAGVNMWRYFVNPILYMERSGDETTPYTVSIDVKQKDNGNFVYSFHAERDAKNNGQPAPQTLHAAVNGAENDTANGLPTSSIRSDTGNSQEKSSGKASVEVENRDSDNKKQGRKKLSEAEKYQNTTSKMAETRTVRNVAEYEKQISRMEKRLETGGQATLNEGGGNFYRVNIREENGEYYAYISDGKNVVAKHKSKAKMEAIRWAGDRMRAEIASRILYNPDTKLRGSYQSDLKRAENQEYPVFKTESGTEVQTVPFWTWVQDKSGHYGLVVGQDINGAVRAWFPFGGDGTGTVVTAANTTLYAVEGDYERRAWNNEIVAEALDDAEESAAARNARKDKMRESREADRKEFDRLKKRDDTLHQINRENGRPMPNKGSGDVYERVARQELDHCEMFHAQAVRLIREHGEAPNEAMRAVWEYEHDKIMERDAEIRVKLGLYDGK